LKSAILIIIALAGISYASNAQEKITSVTLTDSMTTTAIDRPGDVYIVTRSGQIQKLSTDGKLLLSFKADTVPTLFDPRDGARLFIYFRESQLYRFMNPSFNPLSTFEVDPAFAIQPWLICPSGEYKLWILDQADNSLKKVDIQTGRVEVEVVVGPDILDDASNFTAMREYQGFVFLLNPTRGIEIFNPLGIHIRSIEAPGIRNFNFLGEDLYYLKDDVLVFFNLFSATTLQQTVGKGYEQALVSEDRLMLFTPLRVDIFSFTHP
jgi:hypothetical protein